MSRPKSAGGGRSFLDDLLGNDSDSFLDSSPSSASQRQRKSVRFFDENDEEDTAETRDRPHSSTLDSLLNPNRAQTQSQTTRPHSSTLETTSSSSKSKSDWLGLSTNEEHVTNKRPIDEPIEQSKINSSPATLTPDWITAGLKARQTKSADIETRAPFLQSTTKDSAINVATSSAETLRPWQPKVLENATPRTTEPNIFESARGTAPQKSTLSENVIKDEARVMKRAETFGTESGIDLGASFDAKQLAQARETVQVQATEGQPEEWSSSQSAIYLQTKLRILSLENKFLEQTVEQMKSNHQDELKSMISLYEQQMRMTSEMYKRHEEMIQDERDRRINELKSQLEHSEEEMRDLRKRTEQRLAALEVEWQADVQRIRQSNEEANLHLVQQHDEQVHRLEQRLATENELSLQTSTDLLNRHSKTVTDMLARWEKSAHKIEQLQKSVVARQEDLMQTQVMDSEEIVGRKFEDIEKQWKAFVGDLQQHRTQMEQIIHTELEKNITEERSRIDQERIEVEKERQELQSLRSSFSTEVGVWRQQEAETAEQKRLERDKLRREVLLFEERRSLLETLYLERKKALDEEQTRLTKQNDEFSARRVQLDQEQRQLNEALLRLQSGQQEYTTMKELFDKEKEQLAQMALALSRRAEELEKLSEVALKEKLDGIQAIDDMDSMQSEVHHKLANIEESTMQLRKEQQKILLERTHLEQQWAMLKELKESIVCNLCGSAINRVPRASNYSFTMYSQRTNGNYGPPDGASNSSGPLFYSLLNNNFPRTNLMGPEMTAFLRRNDSRRSNSDPDQDQNLLFWQMSAQQDAASLMEETKFLDVLKRRFKE